VAGKETRKKRFSALTDCVPKRFRNSSINYSFLPQLDNNEHFIRLGEEFEDFRDRYKLHQVRHVVCSNALDFAEVIRSSSVFVENQSLGFAVAEALKVKRALVVCKICPNVVRFGVGAGGSICQTALINLLRGGAIPIDGKGFEDRAPRYALTIPALAGHN
jgi:hypothetical protein